VGVRRQVRVLGATIGGVDRGRVGPGLIIGQRDLDFTEDVGDVRRAGDVLGSRALTRAITRSEGDVEGVFQRVTTVFQTGGDLDAGTGGRDLPAIDAQVAGDGGRD